MYVMAISRLVLVACLAFPQLASAKPVSYAVAESAWERCTVGQTGLPHFPEVSDPPADERFSAIREGSLVRVEYNTWGSGSDALYTGVIIELDVKSCAALWARYLTYDGAFATDFRIGWLQRKRPSDAELERLLNASVARPNDPLDAMARAWLGHQCDGGAESTLAWSSQPATGPIAPAQPWHPGVPTRSRRSFWTVKQQQEIGARASLVPSDDAGEIFPPVALDQLVGVAVPDLPAPVKRFTDGGFELREAPLSDRNDGRAIAIYDRKMNRHRWVLLTRGCIQGTKVQWLGAIQGLAIGVTHSEQSRYAKGDAIVVIDPAAGTAFAVALPDLVKDEQSEGTAKLVGNVIQLKTTIATLTVDLAPALDQIATLSSKAP
jgi:hypothetical protein